ncbi:helix-turn-helix domain-containing protein [Butyrivibrio sp. INlla14]|uniref:helix-turn-helix domain-containing protein n=1 Tax=Butyrivibrio sp. INlla14 TaxID=1520808 RepID=UPI0008773957|nr:helix-turn-helix transcriptional regulator [Butyrivibrio sp. INlla14]SCY63330.1 DNA-binding transcriptional regulator, XRE-family HTH domain [Butyrivibrio sp. INlla14]
MVNIGERLKGARNKANMHQADAAKAMGMSRPTLSAIEAGKRQVKADEVIKFADLYGVEFQELMIDRSNDKSIVESERANRLMVYYTEFVKLSDNNQQKVIDFIKELNKRGGKS